MKNNRTIFGHTTRTAFVLPENTEPELHGNMLTLMMTEVPIQSLDFFLDTNELEAHEEEIVKKMLDIAFKRIALMRMLEESL